MGCSAVILLCACREKQAALAWGLANINGMLGRQQLAMKLARCQDSVGCWLKSLQLNSSIILLQFDCWVAIPRGSAPNAWLTTARGSNVVHKTAESITWRQLEV